MAVTDEVVKRWRMYTRSFAKGQGLVNRSKSTINTTRHNFLGDQVKGRGVDDQGVKNKMSSATRKNVDRSISIIPKPICGVIRLTDVVKSVSESDSSRNNSLATVEDSRQRSITAIDRNEMSKSNWASDGNGSTRSDTALSHTSISEVCFCDSDEPRNICNWCEFRLLPVAEGKRIPSLVTFKPSTKRQDLNSHHVSTKLDKGHRKNKTQSGSLRPGNCVHQIIADSKDSAQQRPSTLAWRSHLQNIEEDTELRILSTIVDQDCDNTKVSKACLPSSLNNNCRKPTRRGYGDNGTDPQLVVSPEKMSARLNMKSDAWRTLPIKSDLQSHMETKHTLKRRNDWFSRCIQAADGVYTHPGGPVSHSSEWKRSLPVQPRRFGVHGNSNHEDDILPAAEGLCKQREKTYVMFERLKTRLGEK